MSISTTIKSIQDIMRKDTGVDGDAQRIGQLVWMFFLKIYDDKETEYELFDDHYKSPIPENLRWRNWAADAEGITGDELLDFVNIQLFPTLKNLQPKGDDKRGFVIRGVFEDAYNYMKSGHLMRQVINKIVGGIDFNKAQDRHLFGDLYEQILRDLQNAGNAGEYYTPRPVTQFMVDMTTPKLGEKILDPACGTGGFLTCAIEYVRKQHVKTVEDEQLLQQSIFGVEKKPLPHLLCTTNMILHGIDVPTNVRHDNTLSRPLRDYGPRDRVDVIVTNPPFGGVEEDGIENNFPANFRTRETADLFLVLIMHLLKDGGRAAVVLPDGTLFAEGIKTRIKEQLLDTCNLHTIVRLPNGVFNPYTGIKTNLLFFTKGAPTKDIWFYEHPYPEGYKNYSKKRPMRIEEFASEKAWWNNRVENEFAWKVSVDDIKARNYNLDIKNPHSPDQVSHDPDELLVDYARLQARIATTQNKLKDILSTALFGMLTQGSGTAEVAPSWQRFNDHFDTFFTTESSLDSLKQAVLQLAVMGKLVPQDPKDEPASALLKRMAQTRERLELGATRKKNKRPSQPRGDDWPFAVPQGWEWALLSDLTQVLNGKAYSKDELLDSGTPVLRVGNLFTSNQWYYSNLSLEPEKYCEAGDLIYSWSASFGPFIWEGPKVIYHYHIWKLSLFDETSFSKTFLYKFLLEKTAEIKAAGHGVSMVHMTKEKMEKLPVPVPPLAEQHRIVAKVDELMTLCDQLKADIVESRRSHERLASTLIESALEAA